MTQLNHGKSKPTTAGPLQFHISGIFNGWFASWKKGPVSPALLRPFKTIAARPQCQSGEKVWGRSERLAIVCKASASALMIGAPTPNPSHNASAIVKNWMLTIALTIRAHSSRIGFVGIVGDS